LGKGYLILDRDPLYTREFWDAMKRSEVRVLHLPPSSPNLTYLSKQRWKGRLSLSSSPIVTLWS